jgi:hypothetical protein
MANFDGLTRLDRLWSVGVLEYWSNGKAVKLEFFPCSTPSLHHFITPANLDSLNEAGAGQCSSHC